MAGNKKLHAHDGAPPGRWALLGRELRARRLNLGYTTRESFAIAKGLITANGNPNKRMLNSVENNERQNYAPGRLEQFALAYEVTRESVYALLDGKTDELEPVRQPAPASFAAPVLPPAPPSNLLREDAARPWAAQIWNRLMKLAATGVPDPGGRHPRDWDPDDWDSWNPSAAQLGLSGQDADTWDASRGAMSLPDRGWLTGDWHARREARAAAARPDASSA